MRPRDDMSISGQHIWMFHLQPCIICILFDFVKRMQNPFDSVTEKGQQCRSNVRLCPSNIPLCWKKHSTSSIRQCCFNFVAGVDAALRKNPYYYILFTADIPDMTGIRNTLTMPHTHTHTHTRVCVCVCECGTLTHTHTHHYRPVCRQATKNNCKHKLFTNSKSM